MRSTVRFVSAATGNSITCPNLFVQIHFTRQRNSTGDKIPFLEVSAKTSVTIISCIEEEPKPMSTIQVAKSVHAQNLNIRETICSIFAFCVPKNKNVIFRGKYEKIEMEMDVLAAEDAIVHVFFFFFFKCNKLFAV